jgi:hypothetical protein
MKTLDSTMLRIGQVTQVFFDDLIIESVQDLTRVMHHPEKSPENPLVFKDKPWEHITKFHCNAWNVIHDRQEENFKLWYEEWNLDPHKWAATKERHRMHHPKSSRTRISYAVSDDGIHWKKPPLGIVRENGEDTNVVFGDEQYGNIHAATIIEDPNDKNEERRFKALYLHVTSEGSKIQLASSPEGIHWTPSAETPTFGKIGPHLSDVLVLSFDEEARHYVLYTRHPFQQEVVLNPLNPRTDSFFPPIYPSDWIRMNKRRIFRSESSDLVHWSEPRLILEPDEEDNIDDSFYGLCDLKVGDLNIGFIHVLHQVENTLDVQLVYSRNGWTWKRLGNRKSFITRGSNGNYDQFYVAVPSRPLQIDNEIWIYYGAAKNHHDWWQLGPKEGLDVPEAKDFSMVGYSLCLAKLRLEGFISLHALPVREGILVTRPLFSDGKHLIVNAECLKEGYVEAEIADCNDRVYQGYNRKDCDTYRGDETNHVVTWKGKGDLPQGETYKLRFYIRNAHLYSFRIADS